MPSKTLQLRNSTTEFLTFTKQARGNGIEVRVQDGTSWLSNKIVIAHLAMIAKGLSIC